MDYTQMENNIIDKKRLIYKSSNRGWKETDLLLGEFTKRYIDDLDSSELKMLDLILDESDGDIFNWITKKTSVPEKHNNKIMHLLQNFKYFIN
jgi:antitoxin CptB